MVIQNALNNDYSDGDDILNLYAPHHEKARFLPIRKQRPQISCSATAQLISAFVFATRIVQYFLNPQFQASSYIVCLYSLVYVRPGHIIEGDLCPDMTLAVDWNTKQ